MKQGRVNGKYDKTHGMFGTETYRTWTGMVERCKPNAPHSDYYYKKGITVCKDWLKFENFYKDMGKRPPNMQLDRIDGHKGYYKENCRWVTRTANMRNMLTRERRLPRGVYKNRCRYRARISVNSKFVNLGNFKTIKEAEIAYLKTRLSIYGELPIEYRDKEKYWLEQIEQARAVPSQAKGVESEKYKSSNRQHFNNRRRA